MDVLSLLQRGYSNKEIAQELGISLAGAKFHVSEIISRLGVSSREEASAWQARKTFSLSPLLEWLRDGLTPVGKLLAGSLLVGITAIAITGFVATVANREQEVSPRAETAVSPTPPIEGEASPGPNLVVGRLISIEQGTLILEDSVTGVRTTVSYDDQTQVTRLRGYTAVTDTDLSRLRPGDELHVWPHFGTSPLKASQIGANWVKVIEILIDARDDAQLLGRVNEGIPGNSTPAWALEETRVIQVAGTTDISGMRPVSEYEEGERLMLHAYIADDGSIVPVTN